MDDDLRRTALTERHERAGARLAAFAGWAMPIRFEGTLVEHEAVRDDAGVFDVSHLGTVWVDGPDAQRVLATVFTNDPALLEDGTSQYTLCCDDTGGIVDDLIVYRLAAERWLVVPNAANNDEVVAALRAAARQHDATIRDEGEAWAVLAVQGPRALALVDDVLAGLGADVVASEVAYLGVRELRLGGADVDADVDADADADAVLCRTGYTGEPGCELVVAAAAAGRVWDALVAAGARPCGLGARDTLRLEMGYPLHGSELGRDGSPYEARLGWAVRLDRGPFRGDAALRAAKEAGTSRRLLGLVADGRRPLRGGLAVRRDDATLGVTTSGSVSPTLGRPIALAYLDAAVREGERVQVDVRGTLVDAEVVRPPFVDRDPRG